MKKLIFVLCLALFTINTYADEVKQTTKEITQPLIKCEINGKNYSLAEFDKFANAQPNIATRPCTVNIVVQGSINGVPFRYTEEITFEASWLGCLASKVAAFLVEVFT